jgi:hypothetical protein
VWGGLGRSVREAGTHRLMRIEEVWELERSDVRGRSPAHVGNWPVAWIFGVGMPPFVHTADDGVAAREG